MLRTYITIRFQDECTTGVTAIPALAIESFGIIGDAPNFVAGSPHDVQYLGTGEIRIGG